MTPMQKTPYRKASIQDLGPISSLTMQMGDGQSQDGTIYIDPNNFANSFVGSCSAGPVGGGLVPVPGGNNDCP